MQLKIVMVVRYLPTFIYFYTNKELYFWIQYSHNKTSYYVLSKLLNVINFHSQFKFVLRIQCIIALCPLYNLQL